MENKLNVVFTNVSAFYIIVLKLTCNSDLSRSASIKTLSTCPIFKREISNTTSVKMQEFWKLA